ncbi:DUF2934 domain-containing protein [Devosia soli]|uniref:DUF2934 domain-containing protein n=1 Tax=Devosia soli TaxID=361041 RepID=UPI000A04245A|nr:DUF2934 domain-containing protein [Devosia soli]
MDINENSIRERAHWLWKQAGEPTGRDLEFWLEAEKSLSADGDDASVSAHTDESYNADPSELSLTQKVTRG